jgi:hypothetical protein
MEKAIVVLLDLNKAAMHGGSYTFEAIKDLNEQLSQGWNVKHTYAMGGTGHPSLSSSLVVLEKKG